MIPEEIVEYIISFKFDRRGYIWWEYLKRKQENEENMSMIIHELFHWNYRGKSIKWLSPSAVQRKRTSAFLRSLKNGKPKNTFHIGFYHNEEEEIELRRIYTSSIPGRLYKLYNY